MGEEKLTLKTEVTGADATAASLDKVKKAQDAVTGGSTKATATTAAVAQATAAVDDATASQEKLNASESDFIGVLSRLSPALGGFADAMLKGGKIAGDLAGKQIKVGEVLNTATTAINKNAGALKRLGAAGAVVLGITLITNALAKMRAESERLTKSLDDQRDSLNELRGEQRERGQGIEDIAAQRREGGFTADEARAANQQARRVSERFDFIDAGAVDQAVAVFGDGKSDEDVAKSARLIQSGDLDADPRRSEAARARADANAKARNAAKLDVDFEREARQRNTEDADEVRRQIAAAPGQGTGAIQESVERFARPGLDTAKIAAEIQRLGSADRLQPPRDSDGRRVIATKSNATTLNPEEINVAEQVFRSLTPRGGDGAPPGGPTTTINNITNNNQFQRHTRESVKAQREATKNGELELRRRGER